MNQAAAVLSYEPNITGANGYAETKGSTSSSSRPAGRVLRE